MHCLAMLLKYHNTEIPQFYNKKKVFAQKFDVSVIPMTAQNNQNKIRRHNKDVFIVWLANLYICSL